MGAKLYVGNLSYSVTEERLQQHFAQYGSVVSARIITDKFSGRSKGFGFVEMSSDSEAERATAALNGTDFEGRNIVVSEARPQAPRAPRPGGGGGGRPPRRDRYLLIFEQTQQLFFLKDTDSQFLGFLEL